MNVLRKLSVLAAAFVVASVGSAFAEERIEVKVPFPFEVNGETLSAGQYEVRVDESGLVSIRGEDNRARAIAMSIPADGSDPLGSTPALVFAHSETHYRLSTVWDGIGDGQWLTGQRSDRRRKLADAGDTTADAPTYVLAASVK